MSNKTIKICDICGRQIALGLPGNGLLLGGGDYQVFSTDDGDKDACCECVASANTIMRWLKVQPDKSKIYEHAGFTRLGNEWVRDRNKTRTTIYD